MGRRAIRKRKIQVNGKRRYPIRVNVNLRVNIKINPQPRASDTSIIAQPPIISKQHVIAKPRPPIRRAQSLPRPRTTVSRPAISSLNATTANSKWPDNLPIYVITIDPKRYEGFQRRSARISHAVHKWPGTNGNLINRKRFPKPFAARLRRGQLGCYDSHVRLWQHMVANKIPMMLICEDDATITGDARQVSIIQRSIDELKSTKWHLAFMSWSRPHVSRAQRHSANFKRQWTFCQLFAYLITLDAAKLLVSLPESRRYNEAVDVMLHHLHVRKVLNNVVLYPPISQPVPAGSATRSIK